MAAKLTESEIETFAIERLQALTAVDLELHTDLQTNVWALTKVPQRLQCEGDLGLKMLQATGVALTQGRPCVMIAGTDAPTVPLPQTLA